MGIDPLDHYTNTGIRLIELKAMLEAREGNPAYVQNCFWIRQEITRLEGIREIHAPVMPVSDAPRGGEQ